MWVVLRHVLQVTDILPLAYTSNYIHVHPVTHNFSSTLSDICMHPFPKCTTVVLTTELEKSNDALAHTTDALSKAQKELQMAREKLLEYQNTIARQEERLEDQGKGTEDQGKGSVKDKSNDEGNDEDIAQVSSFSTSHQEMALLRGALDKANDEVGQLQAQLHALRNSTVMHNAVIPPVDQPITPTNINVVATTPAATSIATTTTEVVIPPTPLSTTTEAITAPTTEAPTTAATTTAAEMKRLSSIMHQLEKENATLSRMLAARGREQYHRACLLTHAFLGTLCQPLIHN